MKLLTRNTTRTYDLEKKINSLLLFIIIFICWSLSLILKSNIADASKLQRGIADEIIRFHVIANSDSFEDQKLKLLVKEALIKELSPSLSKAMDINEGRSIINNNLDSIKMIADKIIISNGYSYDVRVSLEECYFPMKVYGYYSFPPGTYEALRVQIGKSEGKNWWCVMFPPLCFVDETYSIVDEETDEQLKYVLTEEEYETLITNRTPVKVKFKLWASFKKLFKI